MLLAKGIDTNQQNTSGDTPLHLAAEMELTAVASFIAMCPSTNVNIQNKRGQAPLHLAVSNWTLEKISDYAALPLQMNDLVINLIRRGANLKCEGILSVKIESDV